MVPDLERDLDIIASKEPMLKAIESKIPEMNNMEKTLKGISSSLDDLVDDQDMLAAQQGRETIKKIYAIHDDQNMSKENKQTMEDMEFIKNKHLLQDLKTQSLTRDMIDSYKEKFKAPKTRVVAVGSVP